MALVDELKLLNRNDQGQDEAKEMKKAMAEALTKSIEILQTGDRAAKVQTLKNLSMMKDEIERFGDLLGDEQKKLIEHYDATLKQGIKTNTLLGQMNKQLGTDEETMRRSGIGTLSKGLEGFIGNSSPFLKMGINVTKGVYYSVKSMKDNAEKARLEREAELRALQESLNSMAGNTATATPVPAPPVPAAPDPNLISAPDPNATAVPVPSVAPAPTAAPAPAPPVPLQSASSGKMTKAMQEMAANQAKQTSMMESLVNLLSHNMNFSGGNQTIPTPASGSPAQAAVAPTPAQAASHSPGLTSTTVETNLNLISADVTASLEADLIQISLLEAIKASLGVPDTNSQSIIVSSINAGNTASLASFDIMNEKLKRLDTINESLEKMVEHNKEMIRMQQEALTNASATHLASLDDATIAAGHANTNAHSGINGHAVGATVAGESKGILAMLLPEIVGEVIGNSLVRGKGIFGGIWKGIKWFGGAIVAALNPMNWFKGLDKISGFMESLFTPSKWLTPLFEMVKSGASALAKPFQWMAGAFGKIGTLLGEWFKPIQKVISVIGSGGKMIPGLGLLITILSSVFSFFVGAFNADEILDKPKELITIWDRFSAGLGSIFGEIVGILDTITGLFGFKTKWGENTTKFISKFINEMPQKMMETIAGIGDAVLNVITAFGVSFTDGVKELGKTLLRGLISLVPGAETLMRKTGVWDKLGLDDKPAGVKETPKPGEAPKPEATATPVPPAPVAVVETQKPESVDVVAITPEPKMSGGFAERARKNETMLGDMKDKKKTDQRPISVAKNSVTNVNSNTFNSMNLATRNYDDSHRIGL